MNIPAFCTFKGGSKLAYFKQKICPGKFKSLYDSSDMHEQLNMPHISITVNSRIGVKIGEIPFFFDITGFWTNLKVSIE